MISAQCISHSYGSRKVLSNIHLECKMGEFVTLLGRNGEGKSTLLRILTGELKSEKGKVFYNDKDINFYSLNELAKIRAVLPQDSHVYFPLKVYEIIELGRSPYSNKGNYKFIQRAIDLTDISHLYNRYYSELSGGEKKRVQLARVLCQLNQKGAIFLDEPINSLDIFLQHKILKILKYLANHGYLIFVILHDWNLAGLYSDRIIILDKGKIISDGSPNQVLKSELLQDIFQVQVQVFSHGKSQVGGYSKDLVSQPCFSNYIQENNLILKETI